MVSLTREEVFDRVRSTMQELFEVEADQIQPETKLIEDLELDSIDAIDLAARLEEITRHRLAEEELRTLRTVDDVVSLIHRAMTNPTNPDAVPAPVDGAGAARAESAAAEPAAAAVVSTGEPKEG
jgi:acyl carrier protein